NTPTNYNSGYYSNGQAIPSELLRSNGFAWNGNSNHIKEAINDGRLFVFHRDHGYAGGTGWSNPNFVTSSISSLTNGEMLPIVFSINCHTGEFSLPKCFSEAFLRHEGGGAVGVFAASYYSYSGYNDGLSAGMIDACWSNPGLTPNFGYGGAYNPPASTANNIRTMGDVMNQGLVRMEQTWGVSEYSNRLFHYFGDPAMRIWTENPHANVISADHASSLSCNENTFTLTNCNTENATVTLVHDGQLLGTATTQDGTATINYELTSGYPYATLTISKENHAPYIQKVLLEGTCSFSPIVVAQHVDITNQGKALLHGEIIESPTGTISESGIIYGTSANLTIDSDEIVLQTIPTITADEFSVTTNYLEPSTRYYYRAYAINENGTGYSEIRSFESQCGGIDNFPYTLDFAERTLPACWNIDDYTGTGQNWAFNNPGSRVFNSTTGDNGFIIVDSDFHGGTGSQNTHLTSPTFDFSIYGGVTLNFEHYYRHATSSSAELFYSINNGTSWTSIEEWTATLGSFTTPEQYSVDLSEELTGLTQVRFKWSYTGDNDYYWVIDDIEILATDFKRYEVQYNGTLLQPGDTIFDYTPVNTDTDLPFNFTVNNIGDQPLSMDNPTATHDNYGVVPFESSTIAPGASGTFDIVYTPTEAGSHNATISFGSDAPNLENFSFELFTNLAATYAGTINVVNGYGTPVENATVEIPGHAAQTTDANGNATFATLASSQTHGFTVTHTNYQSFSGTIGITHQNEEKTITLNGNLINLTFNVSNGSTALNNAIVNLSTGGSLGVNNGVATTEINGIQPITYEVTNYGYEDYTGEADLTLNDTTIDVVMIQTGHQVDVYVTTSGFPVPNAAVSVQSGSVFYTNSEGVAAVTGVQSGYYRSIEVDARGYQPFEDHTNISGDMEFNASLTPNAHTMNVLILQNNEPLEGATVTLDNEPTQTTSAEGTVQFAELNAHPSRALEITKEGMEPILRTVNFNADTTLSYHMQLEGIGEQANALQIYPNPTSTTLTIMHESETLQNVVMYTGAGKKIMQLQPRPGKLMNIDVNHLPEGVYHISITTEAHTYRKKVIIK
ncbi:MAG: C25 family cysteine peptidase, partial [Salinivirgaceae bacterium]